MGPQRVAHDLVTEQQQIIKRKNTVRALSLNPLREDTVRRWLSASQETPPHQGTESASRLILDFSASRTVRNKFLLFKPPRFGISLWQPELTKTLVLISFYSSFWSFLLHINGHQRRTCRKA